MINKSLDFIFGGLTGICLDVLEWFYDHDVKTRKNKPFGG